MAKSSRKKVVDPSETLRIPPYSTEAERGILGAILLEPEQTFELLAGVSLQPEWFYVEAHRLIYETAARMYQQKATGIDSVTVFDALQEAGIADQVGGMPALEALTRGEMVVAHAEYYANILREKATLRRIIRAAEEAAGKCYEPNRSVNTILSESQEAMFAIGERSDANNLPTFTESLKQTFKKLDTLFNNTTGLNGLSTGFKDLDKKMQGLRDSEMIVLAARPSMGKTSLAMNICAAVALGADGTGKKLRGKEPMPVGIFSCEMSTDALITRLLCAHAHVPYIDIINNRFNSEEQNRRYFNALTQSATELQNVPLYIDDSGGLDIADVRARARRMPALTRIGRDGGRTGCPACPKSPALDAHTHECGLSGHDARRRVPAQTGQCPHRNPAVAGKMQNRPSVHEKTRPVREGRAKEITPSGQTS